MTRTRRNTPKADRSVVSLPCTMRNPDGTEQAGTIELALDAGAVLAQKFIPGEPARNVAPADAKRPDLLFTRVHKGASTATLTFYRPGGMHFREADAVQLEVAAAVSRALGRLERGSPLAHAYLDVQLDNAAIVLELGAEDPEHVAAAAELLRTAALGRVHVDG